MNEQEAEDAGERTLDAFTTCAMTIAAIPLDKMLIAFEQYAMHADGDDRQEILAYKSVIAAAIQIQKRGPAGQVEPHADATIE